MKKKLLFNWTQDCSKIITNVKARIIKKPILVLSDLKKSYILETDASDYTMRGILKQKIDEKLHSITFYFRKFTNTEFNYEIYDKELLIIVATFKK